MEYWCVVRNWLIGYGGHLAFCSRLFPDVTSVDSTDSGCSCGCLNNSLLLLLFEYVIKNE